MTTKLRNDYLGFDTDPQEHRKFRLRFAASLIIIGFAVGFMLAQENFTPKRTCSRAAKRAGRELSFVGI
jgi:hypothetical protein